MTVDGTILPYNLVGSLRFVIYWSLSLLYRILFGHTYVIIPKMKTDEQQIEQEEDVDEDEKPQAHILLMRAQTEMLVDSETNAKAETHRVRGEGCPLLSSPVVSLYRLHPLMWFYDTLTHRCHRLTL